MVTLSCQFKHEHTNPANLDTEEARIAADIALRNYHLPGAHDLRILALFIDVSNILGQTEALLSGRHFFESRLQAFGC